MSEIPVPSVTWCQKQAPPELRIPRNEPDILNYVRRVLIYDIPFYAFLDSLSCNEILNP